MGQSEFLVTDKILGFSNTGYCIVPTPPFTFVEGLGRQESLIYLTASPAPLSLVPPPAWTKECSRGKYTWYRSVPLIRPPILYTTSSPKRGGGVFSRTQLVSIIRPLKSFATFMTLMFTVTKVQTIASTVRGHHAWSPYIGEKSCHFNSRGHNIHNDFASAVAILKNSNTVGHEPRNISWYFLRLDLTWQILSVLEWVIQKEGWIPIYVFPKKYGRVAARWLVPSASTVTTRSERRSAKLRMCRLDVPWIQKTLTRGAL